jgi:hypothetical protein
MNGRCGCCSGIRSLTPAPRRNRPGLSALQYRAGTHAMFLRSMQARLSSLQLAADDFADLPPGAPRDPRPLLALTTREPRDFAIALLDAWALVADILTFYQERIANEGYLRTAVERRSILELARLIGYRARPAISASVYLAYTMENGSRAIVPRGSRSQTLPGPGELPQPFETSADLDARDTWNLLQPRATEPQLITLEQVPALDAIYFKGVNTKLKIGDALLFVFGTAAGKQLLRRVRTIEPQPAADRTRVTLVPPPHSSVTPVEPQSNPVVAAVQALAERNLAAQSFGVSPRNAMAKEVMARLERLQTLDAESLEAALPDMLDELREAQHTAARRRARSMAAWLEGMVGELESAQRALAVNPSSTAIDEPVLGPPPSFTTQTPDTDALIDALERPPSMPPANALRLSRTASTAFGAASDSATRLLSVLRPRLGTALYQALGSFVPRAPEVEVHAFRVSAPLFGYNATAQRPRLIDDPRPASDDQWHIVDPVYTTQDPQDAVVHEEPEVVYLDAAYEAILPGSWIAVETANTPLTKQATLIGTVGPVRAGIGRGVYGVSGKTTRIELLTPDGKARLKWLTGELKLILVDPSSEFPTFSFIPNDFLAIRHTAVLAQSERLELAERPYDPVIAAIGGKRIELGTFAGELEAGRWIIVSGERVDIPGVTGVMAAELAMLAAAEHSGNAQDAGPRYTTLVLANALAYRYRRDTVKIYGNVTHATHGETHLQALGSGDAAEATQTMAVPDTPLTYLAAPTPAGVMSTLEVRVNDVLWHERDTLLCAAPDDHVYVTRTDDDEATTIVFGDGRTGARLPTGHENVRGRFRIGSGAIGNAVPGKISMLATRELGVKSVVNPVAATGGANREERDQIRRNAPLAVTALDRLVSVRDYEDFARTFAGIAKASAARISDGRRQLVHVTIAGNDDIPIAESSDLFVNLRQALLRYGDPAQPLRLAVRKLNALIVSAKVRLAPDYLWELTEPKIRAALLDAFSFARRDLGQDALASEVLSVIQAQPGVVYADLDLFDAVRETATRAELELLATTLSLRDRVRAPRATRTTSGRKLVITPAELAYLTPALADTLLLMELTP